MVSIGSVAVYIPETNSKHLCPFSGDGERSSWCVCGAPESWGGWQSRFLVEHGRLNRSISGGSLHTPHRNGHHRFFFFFFEVRTHNDRMGKKATVNVSKFWEDGRQVVIDSACGRQSSGIRVYTEKPTKATRFSPLNPQEESGIRGIGPC